MKIGYVRVSKQEQHEALQIDALKEAGCDKWFIDKMTRSKTERKGLDKALAYVREGGHIRRLEIGSSWALFDPSDRVAQEPPGAWY